MIDDPRETDAVVSVVRSEERLVAGVVRTPVERVRIHRDVVVEQETRTVEVRREVLRIEREPLDAGAERRAGGAVAPPGARSIEVVLREERPVVTVEVVPVERVVVSVVTDDDVVRVRGEVRVEHVDVEQVGVDAGGAPRS